MSEIFSRNSEKEKIYKKALDLWGEEAQINMCIEELGEAIVELSKRYRKKNGTNSARILEELVDVEIMIEQMKLIFDGRNNWGWFKKRKLANLVDLILEEENMEAEEEE